MSEAIAGKAPAFQFRPSFHLWMVLGMCLFVFGGFGMTYIAPLATGTFPPAPPVVHLHGAVFFSWMALLVTQTALVNAHNVKLHRSLGLFGIAIGTLVFFMGWAMQIIGASTTRLGGSGPGVFFLGLIAPPSFAILFIMAIRAVKRPQVHRNLILMATISILMPGINRVYMQGLGLHYVPFIETYMTMNAFLAALLWHEWKVTGSVSRASWIGAAIIVVPQLFNYPVSQTAWWSEFIYWLGDLVYYRQPR
jgi:hypothetical protein